MTISEEPNGTKKKSAMIDLVKPTPFNADGRQPWMEGLLQPTGTLPAGGKPYNPEANMQKMAMHRRGMSLDETRVSSGLVGVGASHPVNNNNHSGGGGIHDSTSTQFHRRVLSHNSSTSTNSAALNTGYYQPSLSQQRYQYPYSTGPLPSINHSISGLGATNDPFGTNNNSNNQKTNPPEVKFVNSTVEALEDQIRKEDAPKKKRTRTTPEQLRILQKAFNTDPMPNSGTRVALAKKLGMNARAVQVWFQNRRAKAKLEAKRAECGGGSHSSGADSPNPAYLCDDYIDEDVDGSGGYGPGDDYLGTEDDPIVDFENLDNRYINGNNQPPHHSVNSYRATNRSLKATGMVGRMAFPPDLDYLQQHNHGNPYYHHQLQYHQYGNINQPQQQHHNHLSRSFSLPYLDSVRDFGGLDPTMLAGTGLSGEDDSLGTADSTGLLSRSDSAPFAPYEFASGSVSGNLPIVVSDHQDYSSGRSTTGNTGSRCQSMPTVDQFETGGDGLVDLMPPPIEDAVWPTISIPDPYHHHHQHQHTFNTNSQHMRRSYSLPNVYNADYYYPPQAMMTTGPGSGSGYPGDTTNNNSNNNQLTMTTTVPTSNDSSRSQSPSDYLPMDTMDLTTNTTPPGYTTHRRTRSHSISHNPDYPENLQDFLTGDVSQYDD